MSIIAAINSLQTRDSQAENAARTLATEFEARVITDGGNNEGNYIDLKNKLKSLTPFAPLILIPHSRKPSKLYAQSPTDGTGDFTFAGSAVDEINSAGVSTTVNANEPRFDFQDTYVEATDNSYYDLNGTSDYVTITPAIDSGTNFFFEWRGFIDATNTDFSIIGDGRGLGTQMAIRYLKSTNTMYFTIYDGTTIFTFTASSFPDITGANVYLAFEKNGTTFNIYVNNVLTKTTVISGSDNGFINFKYLHTRTALDFFLKGNVSYVGLWNMNPDATLRTDLFNGVAIDPKYIGANNVDLVTALQNSANPYDTFTDLGGGSYRCSASNTTTKGFEQPNAERFNVEIGEVYEYSFDYILNSGTSTIDIFIGSNGVGTNYSNIVHIVAGTGSFKGQFTITTAYNLARFVSQSSVITDFTISNISIIKLGNTLLSDGGKTATTWYDKTHAITGAITSATLTNPNGFTTNVHPLTTCPKLRLEPNATNLFLNGSAPVTQTITTVIGTKYTISCDSAGLLTVDETGGKGRGGVVTGVDSFTYIATATSMVVTVVTAPTNVNFTDTSVPLRYITTAGTTVTKVKDQITQKTLSFATNNFEIFLEQEIFNPTESLNTFKLTDGTDYIAIYNGTLDLNGISLVLPTGKNKIIVQNNATNIVAYVNGALFLTGTRKTTTLNLLDLTLDNTAVQEYSKTYYSTTLSTPTQMINATL